MWYANCGWLKNRSWSVRMFIIGFIAFIYPLLGLVYMFVPKTKVSQKIRFASPKYRQNKIDKSKIVCQSQINFRKGSKKFVRYSIKDQRASYSTSLNNCDRKKNGRLGELF